VPNLDRLAAAELFGAPGFLSSELCAELRAAAARGKLHTASLFRGPEILVDERVRRARGIGLPDALRVAVEERLAALQPTLADHFGRPLDAQQDAQLLVYERGAFFRPHQDNSGEPDLPAVVRARQVSAVIFLDRQTRLPEPGSYCGGALTFFRTPGAPASAPVRTEVWGEEGMLVAFRAERAHEVRPVTYGLRHSLVTWFTGS
jgi:predicted 2-oxoglutarate/Fe(II)-dependent dioxygenase YbiX